MKNRKIKGMISLLLVSVMLTVWAVTALAAGSSTIALSSSSVKAGQTLTVTVTISGGGVDVGAVEANLKYDSSVLQFVSGDNANGGGGAVKLVGVASAAGQSSMRFTLTFKALKAGTSTLSLSVNSMLSFDVAEVACTGASATVTVTGSSTSRPPSQSSVDSSSREEGPPLEVVVDGQTLYMLRLLDGVELPDEFVLDQTEFDGEVVEVARGANRDMLLYYLTNETREKGGFYLLDAAADEFYPFVQVGVARTQYTLLRLPEGLKIPDGWYEQAFTLGGLEVGGYACTDKAYEGFYLIYAADLGGKTGFYLYDSVDATVQRYVVPTTATFQPIADPPEDDDDKGVLRRIINDQEIMLIVFGLAALLGGLIVVNLIYLLVRKSTRVSERKRRRQAKKLAAQAAPLNGVSAPVHSVEISSLDEAIAQAQAEQIQAGQAPETVPAQTEPVQAEQVFQTAPEGETQSQAASVPADETAPATPAPDAPDQDSGTPAAQ